MLRGFGCFLGIAGTTSSHTACRPERVWSVRIRMLIVPLASIVLLVGGCGQLAYRLDRRAPNQFIPNPLELPPLQDQFVWSQVVDTVDDYFRISREQPVQNSTTVHS